MACLLLQNKICFKISNAKNVAYFFLYRAINEKDIFFVKTEKEAIDKLSKAK